ncbi:TPA: ribosome biogenesis/translation initiation ATPase RLI [Desulfurococcaceae archaeon]|nr:ribosome biogenesis/translation initiation ATPase RLI [Ignicoccus hospitalis]HIH90652.1 ribosome biogenesis/translation initiation ATPase RLI [Desulfurococcaceae archaeon]
MPRVAVIDKELCKPDKCNYECIRFCPINKTGRNKAIELGEDGKPIIHELVCTGCGICIKKCPFQAIHIENLPEEVEEKLVHRYGKNGFALYGLPVPKRGQVTGIIGRNGAGKSTSLKILSGLLKPNLGKEEASWDEVLKRFRGTELFNYLKDLANGKIRVAYKLQYVAEAAKLLKGTVGQLLARVDERGIAREVAQALNIAHLWERDVRKLSGGELQRFLIAAVLSKDADLYAFDEPAAYLDVKERINMARAIKKFVPPNRYVLIIEHDLAILDYLSDLVHIVYGVPGVYGIVSQPYSTRVGINHYIRGFLPSENMRIRDKPITFVNPELREKVVSTEVYLEWPFMTKKLGDFVLEVNPGEIHRGEIIGILGPNGIGKSTFIKLIAGILKPDNADFVLPQLRLAYKPQYVTHEMFGKNETVKDVLRKVRSDFLDTSSWYYVEVVKRLGLNRLLEKEVKHLSGGELQKLAVAVTLGKEADLYLLDEPSAFLDVEERLAVGDAIRHIVEGSGAAAFVVDHDLVMIDLITDRVMVFKGEPGKHGVAEPPTSLRRGMNEFLKELGITFRRDPETGRPRVNKEGSRLDRMQKSIGEYYYTLPARE